MKKKNKNKIVIVSIPYVFKVYGNYDKWCVNSNTKFGFIRNSKFQPNSLMTCSINSLMDFFSPSILD